MRESDGLWEYIAVYVDDLAFVLRDPEAFVKLLVGNTKYKLKGIGSIAFHLGCDFFRDKDGVLCQAPKKYIEKMIDWYPAWRRWPPREFLDATGTQNYQSLIGSIQWAVSLGRLDVATAVMTLSGFRSVPRQGHLDRARRVVGYLSGMKHAVIRYRTGLPDYSDISYRRNDWEKSVYGDVKELLPTNAPKPLGAPVILTHYVEANLYHDMITGRSVTGIIHFINQTPIDSFSKKQATCETATYGSEFVAARTCVE